jgi:PAT family beta-lactamase induction signal transducer AmpG
MTAISPPAATRKTPHPYVFMFLFIPFGAMTGYVTVTLGFLFSNAGISVEKIAGFAAIQLVPQIFKFLWAPLVDVTLTVKKWHIISTVLCGISVLALSVIPVKTANLPLFTIAIVLSSIAISFVGMAGNSLSAYNTPGDLKGRVSGWIQAGNVGGAAVGGGAGLWLSIHMPQIWMAGAILAITFVLCCIFLIFVHEPEIELKTTSAFKTVKNVVMDVWTTIKARMGLIALILCLMPIGTGAANNLFSAIANDWKAGAGEVEAIVGIIGGLVTAAGCLLGGWVCDKMNRKTAYLLIGLFQAVVASGMAFCPHTATMYGIWGLVYAFSIGLSYAAFNAFVLEVIGTGAAATKFELYASISNAPIMVMSAVAGLAYTKWGANGMLNTEAVCGVAAILVFMLIWGLLKKAKALPETAEFVPEH